MFGVKDPYNATESYDEHLFVHNVWQPCSDLNDRIAARLDVPLGPCRKAYDSIVRQSRRGHHYWIVDEHPLIVEDEDLSETNRGETKGKKTRTLEDENEEPFAKR